MNFLRATATVGIISLGWIALANGLSQIIVKPSPHGLAAFVYAAFLLSFIGSGVQTLHFIASVLGYVNFSVRANTIIGFFSGAASFMVASWYEGGQSIVPVNLFGALLLLYLCLLGSGIAALLSLTISKVNSDPRRLSSK